MKRLSKLAPSVRCIMTLDIKRYNQVFPSATLGGLPVTPFHIDTHEPFMADYSTARDGAYSRYITGYNR